MTKVEAQWREALKFAPNESIASVLTKLEVLGSSEIAIVAEPHLSLFRNPVSMRLLQRKAEDLGISVAVISKDEQTRLLCGETGFASYASLEEFRRHGIRRGHTDQPRPIARRAAFSWWSLALLVGVIVALFALGRFVLPTASVTIVPAAKPLALDVPVIADTAASAVDLASGRIPAQLQVAEVDGQTVVQATGQRDAPDQAARGFVTFTNLTGEPVSVPAGTILLAGSASFATENPVNVPASTKIGDTPIPGMTAASVVASSPGQDGNVRAGSITAIQGPLASKLTVINRTSFLGGSQKRVSYLSGEDQAKAKASLLAELLQQAQDQLHSKLPAGQSLVTNAASQGEGAIEQLSYGESPEQVTSQTTLHMRVLVKGLSFQGADVNQVVQNAFALAVSKQGAGAALTNAPLVLEPPVVTGDDASTISLRVHGTAQVTVPVNAADVADRLRGLDPAAAEAQLAAMPGVGKADVQLWPSWVKRVPALSWRTHISVAKPA